ncbi:hypothetical protein RFI_30311, partial [Reticulomyxa filosa]
TFKQVYEKGVKELQVQLTTYWDYIIVEEFKHKCPDLMDDWSCNVMHRLMNLKPCNEMSLVGHEDHCIYLSLCRTLDHVLMTTIPLNKPHLINEHGLIQPYLVAYFTSNGSSIDNNKEWLKKYIKNATILKDSGSNESMKHLYCSDNKSLSPREENISSTVKDWPQNCNLRSHNVRYRIRLDSVVYEWFRNQKYKRFVFKRRNHNKAIHEEKSNNENIKNGVKGGNKSNASKKCSLSFVEIPSHSELMKILSKQLKVKYDDVYNGIAVEQAIVAKANIHTIQNGAFYRRDESTDQTYFQLYLNSTERN